MMQKEAGYDKGAPDKRDRIEWRLIRIVVEREWSQTSWMQSCESDAGTFQVVVT